MRRIVARSLAFRWIVLFAAGAMMALGLVRIPDTEVDVFPEFAPPRVEIQTVALGNSSNEVEQLITVPIENQLNGIEGLEDMRSKSVAQLSSIVLIFGRGTDELRARQLVAERLAQITATLPTWASPPFMMPALSSTSRIMKIGLTSDTVNLTDMSTIAYWKIRARLLRVPGVAQVAIWGERLPQRHVQVDPEKLVEHDVSLQQVMNAAADSVEAGLLRYSDGAVVGTGGFVESGDSRLNVRHVQPITGPEQLAQVPVLERDGRILRLGDVGTVLVDPGPLIGDAVVNDGPGLLLVVQKFRGANTLEVSRGVEQAMAEMAPGLPGIEYDTSIFRPATFIEQSIDNLTTAMLIGIGLVVLIIVTLLFEWRTAFISLIAIPLSLVAAVLVLDMTGATLNVMVLAGLVVAVGVVVDDAIIDVENIVRRLRQARAAGSTRSTFGIVLDASVEVRTAITYATLINVVAVVPVLFLEGLSGSFFRPLVLSYGLAVLVSMVVALTLTPALCLLMLSRGKLVSRESPVLRVLKRGYAATLARLIKRPLPAIATTLVLLVAGVAAFPLLGSQLLPNFKERDFLMHWLTQPGTSVTEETRVSVLACRDLRQIPGVRNCGSHIGQALLADEVYGVDFGENWISVERRRRLRPDPGQGAGDGGPLSRACIATSRPTCANASRRYSPERASRWWSGSSDRIWPRCRPRPRTSRSALPTSTVSSTPMSPSRPTWRTSRWSPTWQRPAGRFDPWRHPPAGVHLDSQRGSERHLLRWPCVRRSCHVHPKCPGQRHRCREPADRHPGRRPGPVERCRRRAARLYAQCDRARQPVTTDRRRRECRGTGSGQRWWTRSRIG